MSMTQVEPISSLPKNAVLKIPIANISWLAYGFFPNISRKKLKNSLYFHYKSIE